MKNYQKVMVLCAIIFFSFALFGCGVSKEEHKKTVDELNITKAELEKAKTKIAELSGAGKLGTGVDDKLRVAQKKASELSAKLKSMTSEKNELKKKMEQMKTMLNDLQAKLKGFQEKTGGLPTDLLKKR
ncbi:hypothetical protein ACFLZG_04940 [Thermodesulfobacteriota bacterium]